MEENLIRVGLRQMAVFVPQSWTQGPAQPLSEGTSVFAANLAKLGYGMTERLLQAMDQAGDAYQQGLMAIFRDVMNVDRNWTPLVKNWLVPTGETIIDHIVTYFANLFQAPGPQLPCGHIIPNGTFPLERYNGCPFCGTPFEFGKIEVTGQNKKLKVLDRWDEMDVEKFLRNLLQSKTALDATQIDSLQKLLAVKALPQVAIGMKETLMVVIDHLIKLERADEAQQLFKSPIDLLRYLWYKHTGFLQIVEPKTIVTRKKMNAVHVHRGLDQSAKAKIDAKAALKLKYGRRDSIRIAKWLNAMRMEPQAMAEIMHPKRNMWVRFIRALRLAEYARRPGFEKLATLLDLFYNEKYEVWQGKVEQYRLRKDMAQTLALLQQRPGLFARSLFPNMLWFGPDGPLQAFAQVIDQVPARLVFTLNMYAEEYFNTSSTMRTVKPLGGVAKSVLKHPLLKSYKASERAKMIEGVQDLSLIVMKKRFAAIPNSNKTMYIEPLLFKMPLAIGDRSESVQDMPVALMGTRFSVAGNSVRLFMQWGVGMPAQHLDMDLSAAIVFPDRSVECAYYNLAPEGAKHSGDIRSIPEKIGTAEYIELELNTLRDQGAVYVVFASNAYSNGAITPNMSVGWMTCDAPMHVSESTGVAYDPSTVQHQVRIQNSLAKGLCFGVLEVQTREIIWMEMPFPGQTVRSMSLEGVQGLLRKLNSKLSIGNLLKIKAEAQGLRILDSQANERADEEYTMAWAMDAAAVTQLFAE